MHFLAFLQWLNDKFNQNNLSLSYDAFDKGNFLKQMLSSFGQFGLCFLQA